MEGTGMPVPLQSNKMKIIKTLFDSVLLIEMPKFDDERGSFTKYFDEKSFAEAGIRSCFKESYFSVSNKDVIRGMHFQVPPEDHEKLVSVSYGAVMDVVLDIRKDSSTYGKTESLVLSAENHYALYIPKGFAHGFKSLQDGTVMNYLVATTHSPEHDRAISWNSIGFDWGIEKPVMSKRDQEALPLNEFKSPF